MLNILITGATGNVGKEVLQYLAAEKTTFNIIAGVRNITKAKKLLESYGKFEYRKFDFEDPNSFTDSLKDIDLIFLLRPPHIADIDQYFHPLFTKMKEFKINKIVFLSVQGAEKSKVIPHNKIELMMKDFEFSSVILRPSYFMQNLTTTLLDDIKRKEIILPSRNAEFNWIDIADIGEVAAKVLSDFEKFRGEIFELTGTENLNFKTVVEKINEISDVNMKYKSVSPFSYFKIKKREGIKRDQILVMLFLHFLPRFQKSPQISDNIKKITGHSPSTLNDFILENMLIIKQGDL